MVEMLHDILSFEFCSEESIFTYNSSQYAFKYFFFPRISRLPKSLMTIEFQCKIKKKNYRMTEVQTRFDVLTKGNTTGAIFFLWGTLFGVSDFMKAYLMGSMRPLDLSSCQLRIAMCDRITVDRLLTVDR